MMRRLLCIAMLLLPCAAGAGQRVANASRADASGATALARDPKALLALGARSDGLALSGLRNWTITIDYQLYDAQGLRTEAGVFQEWWAGPDDYRMRFSRPGYHLDAWVTPKGSYSIGDPNLPMAERLVYRWMMEPIPPRMNTDGYELWRRVMLLPNSVQFPCVELNLAHPAPEDPDPINPQYCFDSSQPVLRMADTEDGERIVYRALAALRAQYLPGEFVARVGRMPFLSARLVGGRIYAKLPEGVLTPAAQGRAGAEAGDGGAVYEHGACAGCACDLKADALTGGDQQPHGERDGEPGLCGDDWHRWQGERRARDWGQRS